MAVYQLPALDWAAPIVDIRTGRPTPYLQRFWQNLKITAVDGANQNGAIAALQSQVTTINGQISTINTALPGKAPLASPALTGNPTAPTPTAGDNDTSVATTAFVQTAISTKANLASPTFTGTPAAPTATVATNTTQVATTAFVQGEIAAKAPLDSPIFTGTPAAPTPSPGSADMAIATTAFVHSEAVLRSTFATWTAATGTAERTTFVTYDAPTASAVYDQTEMQAVMDALQDVSRRLMALTEDLTT